MKEKIGKLLELLNECKPTVSCANFKEHYEFIDDDIYLIREGIDGEEEHFPMYVCYKKGEFVKWLVENDKIDTDELLGIYWETRQSIWEDNKYELYSEYERLLMLLSLQDEPIEFLRRLLK